MSISIRPVTIEDYDGIFALWNSTEQSKRALNPIDDSRHAIIHHMCVHPSYRREGIASQLVQKAEEALREEGISKIFGLVFKDNDAANAFWEKQGYSLRTNLNYRNKSLNENVPQGE